MGVDDLPPAAGVGDLRPAAGVGDPRPAPTRGGSTNDPDVSLASPSITGTSSSPAPRWTGGEPAPVAGSSSSEKLISASEEPSSSLVDSGVAGRGFPSACAILHALSCFSFLFLFLAVAAFAVSFCFFTASVCRRLISRSSGTGGLEV